MMLGIAAVGWRLKEMRKRKTSAPGRFIDSAFA
jgi:hypothetical protein